MAAKIWTQIKKLFSKRQSDIKMKLRHFWFMRIEHSFARVIRWKDIDERHSLRGRAMIMRVNGIRTVIQNFLKSVRSYWATRSSARSFARTAHSFACSALLASLARSTALIPSLARSLTRSGAHGNEIYIYELNASIS